MRKEQPLNGARPPDLAGAAGVILRSAVARWLNTGELTELNRALEQQPLFPGRYRELLVALRTNWNGDIPDPLAAAGTLRVRGYAEAADVLEELVRDAHVSGGAVDEAWDVLELPRVLSDMETIVSFR